MTKFFTGIATMIGAVFLLALLMIGLRNGAVTRTQTGTQINHEALMKTLGKGGETIGDLVNDTLPARRK